MDDWIQDGLILQVRSGSRAYGTDTPDSDEDSRGVCIPPAHVLLGLTEFEQWEDEGKDHVVYALSKFARLGLRSNPSAIEVLFTEGDDILHVDALGARLREERDLFLCRQLGERYLGYAKRQLQRLERHRRWIVAPPTAPEPDGFGAERADGRWRFPNQDQRSAYQAARKHWDHYRTWVAERNPARAELEARHGYDTKHALHLVRLLRMGAEVLETGTLTVRRPDAAELLAIRGGSLDYDQLQEEVTRTTARLHAARDRSPLPETCDRERIDELVVELHRGFLGH